MISADWRSFRCARCSWQPLAVTSEAAYEQIIAHAQSHEPIVVSAPVAPDLCVTCGHSLDTHDSGPSEDGCRFVFGWGHECDCGWPVRAKS